MQEAQNKRRRTISSPFFSVRIYVYLFPLSHNHKNSSGLSWRIWSIVKSSLGTKIRFSANGAWCAGRPSTLQAVCSSLWSINLKLACPVSSQVLRQVKERKLITRIFGVLQGNFLFSRARSVAVKTLVVIFATQLRSFPVFVLSIVKGVWSRAFGPWGSS